MSTAGSAGRSAGTQEPWWPPAWRHRRPGEHVPCTRCQGAAAQPATLQLPPSPPSSSSQLFLTHFLHCTIKAKQNGAGGEDAGMATSTLCGDRQHSPPAAAAWHGAGHGHRAEERVVLDAAQALREDLGLHGFLLPTALCGTRSRLWLPQRALHTGGHQQPHSCCQCPLTLLGREGVGQSRRAKRGQEFGGSSQPLLLTNSQPPLHPWCPSSTHPTSILLPCMGARWAEAASEAQARDNC